MTKQPRRAIRYAVYGVSAALHVALAAAAVLVPKVKKNQSVAISLSESKKPPPKRDTPPPPPPPPPPPSPKAKVAPKEVAVAKPSPVPPPVAAAPAAASPEPAAFADLGLTMGNGGPGLAVAAAAGHPAETRPAETVRTVRALAPSRDDVCDAPAVKPKLKGALVKPSYTDEARAAQVEGAVRVEMTVDELGNVIAVKVLKGLGYGLDDAAVRAAKQLTFEPGTRCGKAAVTKLTVSMRFALSQ